LDNEKKQMYTGGGAGLEQEGLHNSLDIHLFEISVGLARSNKEDGLAGDVGHGKGSANLVVNRVKLGQDNAVDLSRICEIRKVLEGSIEFNQLVNAVVAYEGLANKHDLVGVIDFHELG